MIQHVIHAWPPNIEAIRKVFPSVTSTTIFSWGDRIYVPSGQELPKWLMTHESVHGAQQLLHPYAATGWWAQYLEDPAFRFAQELPAHAAEYFAFRKKFADPNLRIHFLREVVAARLASPLYGSLITLDEAVKQINELINTRKEKGKTERKGKSRGG